MDDQKYLRDLISDAKDAVGFFSDARKPERERSICAAFLRSLGVDFQVDEIIASRDEPPDVFFRSAHFELSELLDVGRRRHAEWKAELERRQCASDLADLLQPWRSRDRVPWSYLIRTVTEALDKKVQRYASGVPATLDALVYVNLGAYYLDVRTPAPTLEQVVRQGWRSTSVLMYPYAIVLDAGQKAPLFLRKLVGQVRSGWSKADGLFDL